MTGAAIARKNRGVETFLIWNGPGTKARPRARLVAFTGDRIGNMSRLGGKITTRFHGKSAIVWQALKPGAQQVTLLETEMLGIELASYDLDRDVFLLTTHGSPVAASRSRGNWVGEWIPQTGSTGKTGKAGRSQRGHPEGFAELRAGNGASE